MSLFELFALVEASSKLKELAKHNLANTKNTRIIFLKFTPYNASLGFIWQFLFALSHL